MHEFPFIPEITEDQLTRIEHPDTRDRAIAIWQGITSNPMIPAFTYYELNRHDQLRYWSKYPVSTGVDALNKILEPTGMEISYEDSGNRSQLGMALIEKGRIKKQAQPEIRALLEAKLKYAIEIELQYNEDLDFPLVELGSDKFILPPRIDSMHSDPYIVYGIVNYGQENERSGLMILESDDQYEVVETFLANEGYFDESMREGETLDRLSHRAKSINTISENALGIALMEPIRPIGFAYRGERMRRMLPVNHWVNTKYITPGKTILPKRLEESAEISGGSVFTSEYKKPTNVYFIKVGEDFPVKRGQYFPQIMVMDWYDFESDSWDRIIEEVTDNDMEYLGVMDVDGVIDFTNIETKTDEDFRDEEDENNVGQSMKANVDSKTDLYVQVKGRYRKLLQRLRNKGYTIADSQEQIKGKKFRIFNPVHGIYTKRAP